MPVVSVGEAAEGVDVLNDPVVGRIFVVGGEKLFATALIASPKKGEDFFSTHSSHPTQVYINPFTMAS